MTVTRSSGLERALAGALEIAAAHRRKRATPGDLLIALIDDADAARVMHGTGIDLARLSADVLASMVGVADKRGVLLVRPKMTADLYTVLAQAGRYVKMVGRPFITTVDVLVELLSDPAGEVLEKQGLTRHRAICFLSHGSMTNTAPAIPAGVAMVEIALVNDPYTPMEFVVWLLGEVFGLDRERAIKIMLTTHHEGAAACGLFPAAEAERLVARITDLAWENEHPLRCIALAPT